jgi:hypothetical protein
MRGSLCLALASFGAAGALSLPAAAQKTFEGTISYDIAVRDQQMQLSISARGNKVRQDFDIANAPPEAQMYQLIDYGSGEIATVMPAMKRYMVMNMKSLRTAMGPKAEGDDETQKTLADLAPTGRKETIAGVGCEVYTLKTTPGDEWCITGGLGHFLAFEGELGIGRGMSPIAGNPALAALTRNFKDGAVVLRMRMTSKGGETMTMAATKIDRTVPPASFFSVPSNFEEMKNQMMARP